MTLLDTHPHLIVVVPNGCHIWIGAGAGKGYGVVCVKRVMKLAHRVAYERKHGPIPAGLEVDHLCRQRNCCNSDHLEAVTGTENRRRGAGSGGVLSR